MARSIRESVSTSPAAPLIEWLAELKRRSRRWMKVKVALGGVVVATLISVGVLAPVISPYDPNQQDLLAALQAPDYFAGKFFLGTDHVGRDILSRIIYGARISLVIASTVVLISASSASGSVRSRAISADEPISRFRRPWKWSGRSPRSCWRSPSSLSWGRGSAS